MLKEQNELWNPLPNMTLTDTSMFPPITLVLTPLRNSSGPRLKVKTLQDPFFSETTIVRPAPMFGFEDRLLHRLAGVTNIFTSNHMQERYWPVHAIDVGRALEIMLMEEWTTAQTFELYGPKNYSTKEISELVDREIIKKRRHINVPKAIMKPAAYWLNRLLWWPITSADEVEREFIDQQIDPTAKTFKDLGIEPTDLNTLTFHYLLGYRSSQYADLPPATERELREERKYLHVLDSQ
ncbi:NADH-ubiquinone oxidoreductase 40 kDa subunit, mitochondrial [Trichophyton rubrum CBS 118892]|uniref:NADH-ubiquinone oxidoreductase 40 kDa subunit, mitochondrial n=1 Tax=Trichophyton rubrum (strain ATCC MYA-4607 / CBS 118892) TaxID=559305 RepID=A0A080WQN9_TRIRC|nr:NADH-ubiquinone oxidoreductase 40 kDa subunit, mitochondrial [Trichophyton rubrum CBS 118892]KFL60518.1 NADH-ubiquinone oxidoreductase 40 kDa subunit, mitochondrial [Trichophyton rubrum CBS 118892]